MDYSLLTKPEIIKLVTQREIFPAPSLLRYMPKSDILYLLKITDENGPVEIPEVYMRYLTEKRAKNIKTYTGARAFRAEKYGVDKLTKEEVLIIFAKKPGLKYVGKEVFEEYFQSITGPTKVMYASVFEDSYGEKYYTTAAEAERLHGLGVKMPPEAYARSTARVRKGQAKGTLSDAFGA